MKAKETTRTGRSMVAILVLALIGVGLTANRAAAGHEYVEISISVETVIRAPAGSTTEVASEPVPDEFTDHVCNVRTHAKNQHSIHPDNDLLVESGDSSVRLSDVEAEPGKIVEADEMLRLGDLITVSLIMGPDAVFSAGLEVRVECLAEETTTTTEAETTTSVAETTTSVAETTTSVAETTTTEEVSPTQLSTTTTEVPDDAVSPTAETSTTVDDEVLGIEILPFTGPTASEIGLLALALLATGVLIIVGSAGRTED